MANNITNTLVDQARRTIPNTLDAYMSFAKSYVERYNNSRVTEVALLCSQK